MLESKKNNNNIASRCTKREKKLKKKKKKKSVVYHVNILQYDQQTLDYMILQVQIGKPSRAVHLG